MRRTQSVSGLFAMPESLTTGDRPNVSEYLVTAPAIQTRSKTRPLPGPERVLTPDDCRALFARVEKLKTGGGTVLLYVRSQWRGNLRWARNEIIAGGDTTIHAVWIRRVMDGHIGQAMTGAVDGPDLLECVRRAEENLCLGPFHEEMDVEFTPQDRYPKPQYIWSDATYAMEAGLRGAAYRKLVEPVRQTPFLAAGYLEASAQGHGIARSDGLFTYVPETRVEYSLTVRDQQGTGSGWAGVAMRDWTQVEPEVLTARAVDKCQQSRHPVAIEPGRYTVILEPQAVADLMLPLIQSLDRANPEGPHIGPWASHPDPRTLVVADGGDGTAGMTTPQDTARDFPTKITQRVLDDRITISADPEDHDAGFVPFAPDAEPYRAVTWIEKGVLKELSYNRFYGVRTMNRPYGIENSEAFTMSGGTTTIPEMIASTERGLLVTRLVNVRELDPQGPSLLQGGTTADGLWLIERGKITTPVKNFRFRESPLFVFNRLEALGKPVPVLKKEPTIVPPAKVLDFSMTSAADAV